MFEHLPLYLPKEKLATKPIETAGLPNRFFNPGELEVLMQLFEGAVSVLEFGVHRGRNARAAFLNVPTIQQYTGVDVLPGYVPSKKAQATEVPAQAADLVINDPRFRLCVSSAGSLDLTPTSFGVEFDRVFIDGDHSRDVVEHDTRLAEQWTKPGGLIIWHDFHGGGTVDVREVLHERAARGHKLTHIEGTWLVYERWGG